MHICIVGSGASGWLVANQLKELDFISKITVIGSPKIPHIGVGESTTMTFRASHDKFNTDLSEFIKESHAAVKYGVYYQNWSQKDWLHFFKSDAVFKRSNLSARKYIQLLGNKPPEVFIHDFFGKNLWKEAVGKNNVFYTNTSSDMRSIDYPHTYHFDAGQYIKYLKKIGLKNPKVNFIEETVENVIFEKDFIKGLNLTNNLDIQADYYVNTTGQNINTKNIFNEKYHSLSHVLLTNKAVVYPLKYTNKRDQFHPYTIAKTMKYGWRWITPTWERIGTGYVFSNNHVSEDEAINEFINDIGDKTIEPKVVDFIPRLNKKTFKLNSCSIGMANGFLEPLDAPGLSLTSGVISDLEVLLTHYNKLLTNSTLNELNLNPHYQEFLVEADLHVKKAYDHWITFILNQYKTCHRDDTPFWKDHKQVKWDQWDIAVKDLNAFCDVHKNDYNVMMLAHTIASRDINYYTPLPKNITPLNFSLKELNEPTKHHLDWIESFHKL